MTKKNPAAVALGKLGGRVRSDAKAEAARKNGTLGGYPKGRPRTKKPASRSEGDDARASHDGKDEDTRP